MKGLVAFLLALFWLPRLTSQELFPLNDAASSAPKGVWGIRLAGDTYQEISTQRNMASLRLIYGATSRLTLQLTGAMSNHHDKTLPPDLVNHVHIGSQTFFFTQNIQRGIRYPYLFNGIHAYAKYRFLSLDGLEKHFRMAAYGEWSNTRAAHDEAEPNLLDDSGGWGGGLIFTVLKGHFAASLTTGIILSGTYKDLAPLGVGFTYTLVPTEVQYGDAWVYNLSLGYLLYPAKYTTYRQSNWNVYLEFMGKSYGEGVIIQNGIPLPHEGEGLKAGHYVEVHPGLQRIIRSDVRIEASIGFPLYGRSYTRFYPVISFGLQKYLF